LRDTRPSCARATRPFWSCARWQPVPVCVARCGESSTRGGEGIAAA
jgi:hypothetical protein